MRCYSLADELHRQGATVTFICRSMPGDAIAWLRSQGFAVCELGGGAHPADGTVSAEHDPYRLPVSLETEIAEVCEQLAGIASADWLVVDHYALDVRWESAMRPFVGKILCIDDLANRAHDCDLLLDQNYFGNAQQRYSGLIPVSASPLLGPRYALLRPEFAAARCSHQSRDGTVRRLLVFMGGGDSANLTGVVLDALGCLRLRHGVLEVDVVLGGSNPHVPAICSRCADLPWIHLHYQTSDMAGLMAKTDLAIGAAGSTNWERACLGLPSLVFAVADNQKEPLIHLVRDGYVLGEAQVPTADRILQWLELLLDNPGWLQGLGERSARLVDGAGVRRVVSRMLSEQTTFRPAMLADCEAVWRWRNAPEVRAHSFNQAEIGLEAHTRWFEATLREPSRVLLIAEWQGKAVGVVRFDLERSLATISVFRVPGIAGPSGLIRSASAWLKDNRSDVSQIRAEVLPGNRDSLAAFLDAGYRHVQHTLLLELDSNEHE